MIKIGHLVETCHNKKRKVPGVLIVIIKSKMPITKTKTRPINSGKILVRYPYIVYYSEEHRYG